MSIQMTYIVRTLNLMLPVFFMMAAQAETSAFKKYADDTAAAMDAKNYDLARQLAEQAVRLADGPPAVDSAEAARALRALATVYRKMSNPTAAEPYFKRALAMDEKLLGPDHPDLAIDLNELAAFYLAQERFDLAEANLKRALQNRERAQKGDDLVAALSLLRQHRLSASVGWADCLIAATCIRLDLPLITCNVKHFKSLRGLRIIRPY